MNLSSDRTSDTNAPLVTYFLLSALLVVLLRNAWVCDDAYLTLRTVDNWVRGYGLRWNPDERVQVYTHPLWMLLLAALYALTREAYFTTVAVSVGCSMVAAWILLRHLAVTVGGAAVVGVALLVCKAGMDFGTSGLENPLAHLLLVGFARIFFNPPIYLRGDEGRADPACDADLGPRETDDAGLPRAGWIWVRRLTGVVACVGLTRLDLLLLVAPAWIWAVWKVSQGARGREKWRGWFSLVLSLSPLWGWEVFSLVYYGFLFPNTAYAKLSTGIPRWDLLRQGACYFLDSLRADPVLLGVMAVGMALPVIRRFPGWFAWVLGMGSFLVYLLLIGGDFMTGRFFTAPWVMALAVLAREAFAPGAALTAGAVLLLLGLSSPLNPVMSGEDYTDRPSRSFLIHNGIADERGFFYPSTGLLRYRREMGPPPYDPHVAQGREARRRAAALGKTEVLLHPDGTVGFFGYEAGPQVHVVDPFCLGDALLARMPSVGHYTGRWRVGHYTRYVPSGYLETLRTGSPQFEDGAVAQYYEELAKVIRGPLFATDRWAAIARLNWGRWNRRLENKITLRGRDLFRQTGSLEVVPEARSEEILVARENEHRPGMLCFGPYLTLPRGQYGVRFRLRYRGPRAEAVAVAEVRPKRWPEPLASRTLPSEDFLPEGRWTGFEMGFEITPKRVHDLELRVHWPGSGELALDEIILTDSPTELRPLSR